jgi:hypothetical protein
MKITRRDFVARGVEGIAGLGAAPFLLTGCRSGGTVTGPDAPFDPSTLVGAHYYVWYPALFAGGRYLRARLLPAQRPELGEYSSSSVAVAEQHIAWAASCGIDFFAIDWWPGVPERNAIIDQAFVSARNLGDIRFCIFYELWNLGYDEATATTPFDAAVVERFLADMDEIATRYFRHRRYLRVEGRPVIILYVTRTATGRFEEAMIRFRARMKGAGFDPCVIGDEVYWEVARDDGAGYTDVPQQGRIALFDAITAYNLYDESRTAHAGYGASSSLLTDAHSLYERYRRAAAGRPVIPLAMPGYNDRGLRLEADHRAIPREWTPGAGEGSFFVEWLRRFTLPEIDARLLMLLITSWNEWSEDTAIEPIMPAPTTTTDESASGIAFTQGFAYSGYGTRYLESLREATGR